MWQKKWHRVEDLCGKSGNKYNYRTYNFRCMLQLQERCGTNRNLSEFSERTHQQQISRRQSGNQRKAQEEEKDAELITKCTKIKQG